jgi:cell division protein FtsB
MYLAWVLARGIWDIRLAYRRIDEAREVLALEQAKAEKLKEKWEEVQTREYLEKVARNDLNMQKEGETIVVLPGSQPASAPGFREVRGEKELPNWEKWWNLVK